MSEIESMDDIKDRLVLAALNHVPFEGWSPRALREGAKDAGFDATMSERAFPGGAIEAIDHFTILADRRMVEAAKAAELEGFRRSERIRWLVRQRIEPWADHRESVRRAVTFLTLPIHSKTALLASWRMADAMWNAAGDGAADFSYYTKRITLMAVYSATLLYWLTDESEGFAESWAFLDRRLADALKVTRFRIGARKRMEQLPNPLRLLMAKASGKRRFGVKQS